jgi:hypothetical protein
MTTPREAIRQQAEAEIARLEALIATCESDLHKAPVGCPHCKRDTRQRDLIRALLESAPTPPPQGVEACPTRGSVVPLSAFYAPSRPPGAALRTLVEHFRSLSEDFRRAAKETESQGYPATAAWSKQWAFATAAEKVESLLGQAEAQAPEQGCAYCYTNSRGFVVPCSRHRLPSEQSPGTA